jgi:tricarballylate dehydrogenase
MPRDPAKLVVVGHGAAGLAAALAAAEAARSRGVAVDITVLEKAREDEAGGNTRWSPSNMRLDAPDRIDPGFVDDMLKASGEKGDVGYFRTLADNATATVGWLQRHGVEFITPLYYLSAGPARIQPVGGGSAIVAKLLAAAKRAGVKVRYECEASRLVMTQGHRIGGIEIHEGGGAATTLDADAVILASGGFQGNPSMMRAHFGSGGDSIKLISPGTRFDTGDGIRMATEQGAAISGDWDGMHLEPVDPRSQNSAPVVLVYPYGIVVDQHGHRFFDEGGWRATSILQDRSARRMRSSTPGCSTSRVLSARSARRCRRFRPIRSRRWRRRSAFPEAICEARSTRSTRRRPATPRGSMRRAAIAWRRPER